MTVDATPDTARRSDAEAWFARLWGVAALAHIYGNYRSGALWPDTSTLGVATFLLGIAAIALVLLPSQRRLLGLVAALTLVTIWFEAPFIGNHFLVAGFVSAAILVALTRPEPWVWFAPTGRWILIGFYSWAAFNKLNTGFFNRSESCGLVYANQGLSEAGLPRIPSGGAVAFAVILATAAIELSVPVLLIGTRTRRAGVLLGMGFHFLISLDLGQHFFDFTGLLFALFALFLPGEVASRLERRVRLAPQVQLVVGTLLGLLLAAAVGPGSPTTIWLVRRGVFLLWVPFGFWLLWVVATSGRGTAVSLRLPSAVARAMVLVVMFNGVTPYLELKTGFGFNMYANLFTADGKSNHFLIRRTFPLTAGNRDPIEILATEDDGLAHYIGSGWLVPERNLRDYLSGRPDVSVTYRQAGVTRTATGSEIGRSRPVLARKFQLFRAIDSRPQPRCQQVWLPAF